MRLNNCCVSPPRSSWTPSLAARRCLVVLAPAPVTLATGTPGAIYHPVGNAICRMFNLPKKLKRRRASRSARRVRWRTSRGSENGKSTFALSQTDVAYAAFRGEGPFATIGSDPKLRLLIALYPEAFTVVARADSGVRDFQDLRGKRLGLGNSGAGYTLTRDTILASYGWTTADFASVVELDPADQNRALCGNEVDAIFFEAGHPNGLTQEATTGCGARLVRVAGPPIDRLLAAHPFYMASIIRGGMYTGNPQDVATIGTQAVLVTSSDQPDELAYAMVKAVFENFADFRRLHPALATLRITDMVPNASSWRSIRGR